MPQDALDYQRVVDLTWQSPVAAFVLWEQASRAPIVSAAWLDGATSHEISVTAAVQTRDRAGYSPDAGAEELAEYLKPTASSPNTGIVLAKANEIVGARTAPLDKARAIYDWVVDNTFRRAETRGCAGSGPSRSCCNPATTAANAPTSTRSMSASARAAGLPARGLLRRARRRR